VAGNARGHVGIPGMVNTAKGQTLIDSSGKKPQVVVKLPANFAGRNVPDLSVNSDPDTGYTIFYTSDQNGFEVETFIGGTSFASPQLNGVTALFDQALGGRVGLLNFPLYELARFNRAYGGSEAPLRDIKQGDNWFYDAHVGYDQASGLGVPNVANLLAAFERYMF
jgi:kumamolisin